MEQREEQRIARAYLELHEGGMMAETQPHPNELTRSLRISYAVLCLRDAKRALEDADLGLHAHEAGQLLIQVEQQR